jgi:hypothetical protein
MLGETKSTFYYQDLFSIHSLIERGMCVVGRELKLGLINPRHLVILLLSLQLPRNFGCIFPSKFQTLEISKRISKIFGTI